MAPVIYKRQNQIFEFIKQYIQNHGSAPTLREIADAMGVSSLATVHEHLMTLVEKGLIKRKEGKRRSIDIVGPVNFTNEGVEVPILGFIAAGAPIEPYTDPNASMAIPSSFSSQKRRVYVLQVRGESMIEEQIRDGDYVIIGNVSLFNNYIVAVSYLLLNHAFPADLKNINSSLLGRK